MSNTPAKVVVFDSGLGGTTIFEAIRQQYPNCQLIYCSDNEAFPYGNKNEAELILRVGKVLTALNQAYQPDIFVIACNTASTVALPEVRSILSAPVIGVVPAIKPAALIAKSSSIGLLATPGTIARAYTQTLIDQFAPQFNWIKVGSSELVSLAEQKMYGQSISHEAIYKCIEPFTQKSAHELDTVVLACTHFPLLKQELQNALPQITHWIDSSAAIAKRTGFWLHEIGFRDSADKRPDFSHELVITKKLSNAEHETALCKKLSVKNLTVLAVH